MYKIYIGCLPASTTTEQLKAFFAQYGQIQSVRIVRRSANKLCSGNGIVSCQNSETFETILQQKEKNFHGRIIYCERLLRGEKLQEKNMVLSQRRAFLSNLPAHLTDKDIEVNMAKFGPVQNAYRIKTLNNTLRPFGFVTFFDKEATQAAISARIIEIDGCHITISKYSKNDKISAGSSQKIQAKPKKAKKQPNKTKRKTPDFDDFQGKSSSDNAWNDIRPNHSLSNLRFNIAPGLRVSPHLSSPAISSVQEKSSHGLFTLPSL